MKIQQNLAKFGQICEILGKKQQKIQRFLKEILRLESGAPPREVCSFEPRNNMQLPWTLNPVQTPWNFVEEFGIAGNPNKGHSVSSQLDQTETWQCHHIPSIFASLSHGRYSRSRARVALGRELQLPMSFPWPIFPGLDQDLFPPMVFLVFWDSIPKRCKGVHS